MYSDVGPQVVPAGEGTAAPLTLVALLPRVSPDVVHQGAGVGETPPADVTLVGLLP